MLAVVILTIALKCMLLFIIAEHNDFYSSIDFFDFIYDLLSGPDNGLSHKWPYKFGTCCAPDVLLYAHGTFISVYIHIYFNTNLLKKL